MQQGVVHRVVDATEPGRLRRPRCPSRSGRATGVPESGNGTIRKPQAPLLEKVLSMTVSLRPPDSVMPVPVGPAAALPASGTLGLLLSCT